MADLALGRLHLDADNLLVERPGLARLGRLFMAVQGEPVEIFLGKAMFLGDHLRAHELAEHDIRIGFLQPRAFVIAHPFLHVERGGGTHRHAGHGLDTIGDHDILRTAHHRLRRELHRLLRAAALPVDRHRRHAFRQTGGQHGVAADMHGLFAALHHAAGDNVFDGLGIDPRARHQLVEHMGAQIDGMHARKLAPPLAAGGTDGIYDIGFGHGALLDVTDAIGVSICNLKASLRLRQCVSGTFHARSCEFPACNAGTARSRGVAPKGHSRSDRGARGLSSAGRALQWHCRGQRFDPARLHHSLSYASAKNPTQGILEVSGPIPLGSTIPSHTSAQ